MMMTQQVPQQGYYDPNMVAAQQQGMQMQQQPVPGQVFSAFTQAPQAPVMPQQVMGNPFANGYAAPAVTPQMAMQAPVQTAPQMAAPQAPQAPAETTTTETKVTI
jgi:hypothetical protein